MSSGHRPTASLLRFTPFAVRSGGSANLVVLLFRRHRPAGACRPVGQRHRNQLLRLAWQHPAEPRVRCPADTARVLDNRYGSRDQRRPHVSLAHLRYPAQPRLAPGRVLPRYEGRARPRSHAHRSSRRVRRFRPSSSLCGFRRFRSPVPPISITDSGGFGSVIPEDSDHLGEAEVRSGAGGSGYGVEV